jgi:hypothetical protein
MTPWLARATSGGSFSGIRHREIPTPETDPLTMHSPFTAEIAQLAAAGDMVLSAEPLYAAPRDVASPPGDMEEYHLVTLRRAGHGTGGLQLVFTSPLAECATPTLRDILWWLAGDAWAIDHAGAVLEVWARAHGYPRADPASARLFARHVSQASSLKQVLGDATYHTLLAAYEAEVTRE